MYWHHCLKITRICQKEYFDSLTWHKGYYYYEFINKKWSTPKISMFTVYKLMKTQNYHCGGNGNALKPYLLVHVDSGRKTGNLCWLPRTPGINLLNFTDTWSNSFLDRCYWKLPVCGYCFAGFTLPINLECQLAATLRRISFSTLCIKKLYYYLISPILKFICRWEC